MKILIIAPAPENILPSQRFRFEQYIHLEAGKQHSFELAPFFDRWGWFLLHHKNHYAQKIYSVFKGFLRRSSLLFKLAKYDYVYIHREASAVGPPIFEWWISKVARKKIIYDFDDAIWVNSASAANPGVGFIKCTWKVKHICRYSQVVTVGNDFLADYARQFCNDVRVIPTVVNTETRHNRLKTVSDTKITIGWTGTFTNFVHLNLIIEVIKKLQEKYDFNFLIIADKDPNYTELAYSFKKWNADTEIDDLMQIDIGLMPLADTVLERGKCAFKAIQYMSLGIPSVVSAVGANKVVVQDKINGFWATSFEEWYTTLSQLLTDKELRNKIGAEARKRIVEHYSVAATESDFFELFTPGST